MSDETLKLVTPSMRDATVKAFQESLNLRFERWSIANTISTDGEYGPDTDHAARQVCHGLGLDPASYADGMTPGVRIKIRDPDRRTAAELAVAAQRKDWLAALRARLGSAGAGPKAAIAYAKEHVGVSENPAGSNRGPQIDIWNRAVGTTPGKMAFWCGAFVNGCLHAAGFPDRSFLAFCPSIESRAKGGDDGWSWHAGLADGKPGDLVLYTEPPSATAAHVELVVTASPFDVIGGNTSADPSSGNQSNGGCVAEHHRDPNASGLKFKGYARPPWNR